MLDGLLNRVLAPDRLRELLADVLRPFGRGFEAAMIGGHAALMGKDVVALILVALPTVRTLGRASSRLRRQHSEQA